MNCGSRHRAAITSGILIAMAVVGPLFGAGDAPGDRRTLGTTPPSGIPMEWWNRLLSNVDARPYSAAEIKPCIDEAVRAAREGFPVEAVMGRLLEGAVKQAEPTLILQTLRQRIEALRLARKILNEPDVVVFTKDEQQALLPPMASALETGVAVEGIRRALNAGRKMRICRLKTVLQTGEYLKLMGMSDEFGSGLMEDFAARDLCCGEMLRAVRLTREQHRAGMAELQIRDLIWQVNRVSLPPCGTSDCPRELPGTGHDAP